MELGLEKAEGEVAALAARAERRLTRRGADAMVWHIWGSGPPMLLLHGARGSWTHWFRNVAELSTRVRLIVPDLPGFGDSDLALPPHTAEALAQHVISGLETIVPPSVSLDLVGFSFGGIIGGIIAAELGDRIHRLGLVSPSGLGLPIPQSLQLVDIEPEMTAEAFLQAHRHNLNAAMISDPRRIDDVALFIQITNIKRSRFRSTAIQDSDLLLRALRQVRVPVTSIWGRNDALVGENLADRRRVLDSALRGHEFLVIEEAGHWAPFETPAKVNAILARASEREETPSGIAHMRPAAGWQH